MMLVGQKSYSLVKFKRLDQPEAEKLLHQTRAEVKNIVWGMLWFYKPGSWDFATAQSNERDYC